MADETTTTTASPSWVGSTDAIVKMLMQGRQPAGVQTSAEDEQNPYLRALAQDAAVSQVPDFLRGGSEPSWQGAKPTNLASPMTPAKPGEPFNVQIGKIHPVQVSDLLQMGQYQLHPSVEAARQRVVQALLQRPHGIIPTKA